MILYHATTKDRGEAILKERCIRKEITRYYNSSTQGYIYLTNEITFALYFANSHNISDHKNSDIYFFEIDVPLDILEPDEDEIQIQKPFNQHSYNDRLELSLKELKSCRTPYDLKFSEYPVRLFRFRKEHSEGIRELLANVAYSYDYVIQNYNQYQKRFIDSIVWSKV